MYLRQQLGSAGAVFVAQTCQRGCQDLRAAPLNVPDPVDLASEPAGYVVLGETNMLTRYAQLLSDPRIEFVFCDCGQSRIGGQMPSYVSSWSLVSAQARHMRRPWWPHG
jgi:hypothetical protein